MRMGRQILRDLRESMRATQEKFMIGTGSTKTIGRESHEKETGIIEITGITTET